MAKGRYSFGGGSLPYSWKRDNPEKVAAAREAGFRFRSQPGAGQSPRNYQPIGVNYDQQSGFSTDKSWNAFFRPSRIASGLDTAPAPDMNAGQAPATPTQPTSLTEAEMPGSAPLTSPPTPANRYQSVINSNLQYFGRKGVPPPAPTSFVNRYGTGSSRPASALTAAETGARNLYGGMAQPAGAGNPSSIFGLETQDWWNF